MFTLRNAAIHDAQAIGTIYHQSWTSAYCGILSDNYLKSLTDENCTPQAINTKQTIVACDNDIVIGVCYISPARESSMADWGEIVSLYLRPDYFGKGVGRLLLNAGIVQLQKCGYPNIYLWVLTDNIRARKFYEKNGWICNGDERTILIDGVSVKEVRYINVFIS